MSGAPLVSAQTLLDVTSLTLTVEPSALRAALARTWPAHGVSLEAASTVLVEWWRVHHGQIRLAELDQATVSRALGAVVGGFAALLSPAALAAPERSFAAGARGGAARAERVYRSLSSSMGQYRELAVIVPGLRVRGCASPVSYVAAMWTDSAFARSADLALGFGLHKYPGSFHSANNAESVRDARGVELLQASFEASDEHAEASPWDPLALGVVGRTGALSRFERIRPPTSSSHRFTLEVARTLGGVLPRGRYRGVAQRWDDVPTRLDPPHRRLRPLAQQAP